jgi:pyruvate,water dikinase
MGRISRFFESIFSKKGIEKSANVEELRAAFKARYHQFKLLLNANNKALEIMAEMEEALRGTWPFGMSFVRSRSTSVSTNVFQIVRHLNELSAGKYEALYERFKEIQRRVNPFIYPKTATKEGPLVLPLRDVDRDMADQAGSKLANLGEIRNRIQLRVPDGFVITAQAYHRFMEQNELQVEIDKRIQATDVDRVDKLYDLSAGIQQLIIGSSLPEYLERDILENYSLLKGNAEKAPTVAMRSSALGEDLAGTSFAGQYRSELNVSEENLIRSYKEIIASKYGVPAMSYRFNRGIRDEDVAMCVGCICMVDAVAGGVVYSRDPMRIRDDVIVINSVWGLPKSVVDGSTNPDFFLVSRGDPIKIIRKEIAVKEQKFVCYADEGVCRLDTIDEESNLPSLSDEKAIELARLAVRLEEYYGIPQDIEWAIEEDGSITLLQCRPLQKTEVQQKFRYQEKTGKQETDSVLLQGGMTASPGAATGPVYVVKKDIDTFRFPEGAVLVAAQALPRWATLLNRAAAVVTEQGSIAGHLGNVSREFGVPALFGLKGAIDKLKNGELITVDADSLTVYEGRVDDLLKKTEKSKNLMEGSPVFEALNGASRLMIPLHLLDPGAPEFRPDNCKTFHDITRFCHEKAVEEMFRFGKEHHFLERSSKQLLCEVPMQWWVLNLDDGFYEEVEGKHVKLENIGSIPMLALWEGITAVPWAGPPPVDGKGLMSVMFQATANTALVPGMRSQYADRNYFMISKNYCSLTSRLGFHFSTVETLVSDRSSENYISFQYKGGAADYQRKRRRIIFVKDILEKYGFRVDVKEDSLIARLEDYEEEFMKTRLKILGYLTMHTRQLDMIMANDAKVSYYRSKVNKDIHDMVGDS